MNKKIVTSLAFSVCVTSSSVFNAHTENFRIVFTEMASLRCVLMEVQVAVKYNPAEAKQKTPIDRYS